MSKIVLFQGDSITDAGRDRAEKTDLGKGYPYQVAAQLGTEKPGEYIFYNRAISGNRSVDVYARMKEDIVNLKPDYMSLLMGANDVWHEFIREAGVSSEKFAKIYDMMLTELEEELPDMKMLIFEPYAIPDFERVNQAELADWHALQDGIKAYAAIVRRVAQKHNILFVPLQKMFEDADKENPGMWTLVDGIHPTIYGHQLIKREWLKAFETIR